jgi:peptidoglycan/xylan/chitin deacetylase (PgdA/CDA1 family)
MSTDFRRMQGLALRWAASCAALGRGPTLSILIFHRVRPVPDPLFPGEMTASRFEHLMTLVARAFNVLTLGQAITAIDCGALPRRSLVITFDDGYADNAQVALPILRRHGLPATFFIASSFLDGGRMWNDTVIECLRATRRESVDLSAFGLGRASLGDLDSRRNAIEAVLPKVKYLPMVAREEALAWLIDACSPPRLPDRLMMTSDEVRLLHRAGMEIGGHTARHPVLGELSSAEAEQEIRDGRAALQNLIDAPVEVFAYPNGKPHRDYRAEHVEMVRRLGFRGAVSTAQATATLASDRYQLPRFTPWDMASWRWSVRLVAGIGRTNAECV